MEDNPLPILIRVLGELVVQVDGQVVKLPASRKTRALLAYLALAERPQRRERLCEIFWEIPDDPRGSLRWSLSKIRKILESDAEPLVLADRENVSLRRSRISLDVDQIYLLDGTDLENCTTDELEAAEELFRGPFLAGLGLPRCLEFEAWRTAHWNRLSLVQVKLLTALVERHSDRPEDSLRYLTKLQALRPEDESLRNRINHVSERANREVLSTRSISGIPDIVSRQPGDEENKPAIVVLPFSNISEETGQDYFADGITDDIITALSRIRWLFVIARNTSFAYRGVAVKVPQVARELGVRYVLEGSVQRAGDRIRINAQLIDGDSGSNLWAERYDRQLDDVFKVQDEITENIAGALEPQMVVAEDIRVRQIPEQNLGAWDLTIRAMALCREFTNKGSRGALELLDRALEIDQSYARAWSQKAWITCWRIHQGWDDVEPALDRAVKAAERAVYHDPDEPWGHIAWLFIATIKRDGDLLVSAARRAIEVNPNFAMAYSWLGAAYALTGQGEKSFEYIEKARRLSPRDIFREEFDVHASFAHFQIGDYREAVQFATKASIPRPDHVYPLLVRATSYAHLGMIEDARNDIEKVEKLVPGYSVKIARESCVFVNNTDIDRFVDGLKKAGLGG